MAYRTTDSWIREQLDNPERKLKSLQILQNLSTGGSKEVKTLPLSGKTWNPEQVLRVVKGLSEQEVQDRPGRHSFELRAFFEGDETASEHISYTVEDGEFKPTGSRNLSEGANLIGIVGQFMRHNETIHLMMKTMSEGIAIRAVQREDALFQREEKFRVELNEAYAIVREASFAKTQTEHNMQMERLRFERETSNQQLMLKQAPGLLNAVSGQEIVPNEMGDTALIDEIALNVDPEKLEMLVQAGILPAKNLAALQMRFKTARDKREKELEELKRIPAGDTGEVSNVLPMVRPKEDVG